MFPQCLCDFGWIRGDFSFLCAQGVDCHCGAWGYSCELRHNVLLQSITSQAVSVIHVLLLELANLIVDRAPYKVDRVIP